MKKTLYLISVLLLLSISTAWAGPKIIGGGNAPPPATSSVPGIVELATDAETVTGTATDIATTPANITAKMAAPGAIGGTTPAAGTFTDLAGNVPIVTHNATEGTTAPYMKGQTHVVTGAYTISLPTAVVGYRATFMATTAATFSIDVATGTDVIYLNGTALTAGYMVTSDGTIRAKLSCECVATGYYECTALQGIFFDGGGA